MADAAPPFAPRLEVTLLGTSPARAILGGQVDGSGHPVVTFKITRDDLLGGGPQAMDLSGTTLPAGVTGGPSFLLAYASPQEGNDHPTEYNQLGRAAAMEDYLARSEREVLRAAG